MPSHKSQHQNDIYRDLFQNMPYGFIYCQVIYDEEGRPVDFIHLQVNGGYKRLAGIKNIVGLKASELFPDIRNSHPGFIERHLKVAETGLSDRFEFYFEQQGQWLDISIYSSQKEYFAVIMDDITDRKMTEQLLIKSEERFKTLFNSHSAIQALLDPDTGKVLDVNQEACDWYGWSVDELKQMYTRDINTLPPEAIISSLKSITAESQNKFVGKHRRADGSIRDVEIFRNKIELDGKAVIHVITHDVTERKQAEIEREKLQEQLQQSQKMEMVGQLAGGIAHDFNTMLGVIIGHAEMALMEEGLPNTIYTGLETIQKAAIHSAELTRQLLSFARKQIAIPQLVELNMAVNEMLSLLKRLIGEDITLQWIPNVQEALLKIDPSQLDQILTNLIVNARDAISGTGKITITTSRPSLQNATALPAQSSDFSANYVTLTVTDTGCGIDKKNLQHIFEPFFTTKGVGKGTGLGLSTVYGIVKQNHGFVECDSTPGKGTSIRIQLPLHNTEPVTVESKSTKPLTMQKQQTVLLVDDQPDILDICKRMLEQKGFAVIPAGKPQEAILIAEKHNDTIDLLLTDVVMPEMNGCELSNKLLLTCPNLKTLFMSGYTADIIASHGLVENGVNFIQKPFTSKKLINSINELLNPCTV